MKKTLRFIFALILTGISTASAFGFLSVDPGTVELKLAAGKKYQGQFVLKNTKSNSVSVTIEVQEYWSKQTGTQGADPAEWLSIAYKKPFELGPGKEKRISYKVKIPKKLAGESMAMVFFNTKDLSGSGSMNFEMRHGIPIYIAPSEGSAIDLSIEDLSAYFVSVSSVPKTEFSLNIFNKGNIHTRPSGDLLIYNNATFLEKVKLREGWPVFPGKTQKYGSSTGKLGIGTYRIVAEVDFGKNLASISGKATKEFTIEVSSESIVIK